MNPRVVIYLDTDTKGNDLLDNAANNIPAGWYLYAFPLDGEPLAGPFETAQAATLADHGEDL